MCILYHTLQESVFYITLYLRVYSILHFSRECIISLEEREPRARETDAGGPKGNAAAGCHMTNGRTWMERLFW